MLTSSCVSWSSLDYYSLHLTFYIKFDHSSYSKNYIKYHFFCYDLLYQYKIFKNLKFNNGCINFWIRQVAKFRVKKSNELQFETDVVINNKCWLGAGSSSNGSRWNLSTEPWPPYPPCLHCCRLSLAPQKVLFQLPSSLLLGWVEMNFMGWVLKWNMFGCIKIVCIS